MALKLITAPELEPVTLAEIKLHAHINHDVEDSILTGWIKGGRMLAEDFQRRAFITQTWELSFDGFPCLPILLPRSPIQEVVSIKIYDTDNVETALDLTDYLIDVDSQPGRIDLAYGKSFPSASLRSMNSFKIQYKAGYGVDETAVPQNVKDAIMLYCTYRYENRAAEGSAPDAFYALLRHDRIHL